MPIFVGNAMHLPSSSCWGGPVWPDLYRPEHAEHSVPGPSGPGPLPDVSLALAEHHMQRHEPPSHRRMCTPTMRGVQDIGQVVNNMIHVTISTTIQYSYRLESLPSTADSPS